MSAPYVVGVTGGIGSGKSAVTARFAGLGVDVVDADLAARAVVAPGTPGFAAIVEHFGDAIVDPGGQLDRAALRQRVFDDDEARRWLEGLTHPLIGEEIARGLAASTSPYAILSSPLLLEGRQRALVDCVLVVDVPEDTQLARTMARDDNDEALVRRIMAAQAGRAERLAGADMVIDNSGPLAALDARVAALHRTFLARAQRARQRP